MRFKIKKLSYSFSEVGVKAIDAETLEIQLHSVTPYFLSLPTHFTWWPVHPPTILKHGSMVDRISKWTQPKNFVGNGPFALKTWRLNNGISVVRNPFYREADILKLNGIEFLPINLETEERAFRAGQIHLTSNRQCSRFDTSHECFNHRLTLLIQLKKFRKT